MSAEPDYDQAAEKIITRQAEETKELARRVLIDKARVASSYLGFCVELCVMRDDEALGLMLDRFIEAAREISKLRGQLKP